MREACWSRSVPLRGARVRASATSSAANWRVSRVAAGTIESSAGRRANSASTSACRAAAQAAILSNPTAASTRSAADSDLQAVPQRGVEFEGEDPRRAVFAIVGIRAVGSPHSHSRQSCSVAPGHGSTSHETRTGLEHVSILTEDSRAVENMARAVASWAL
jgi:hypothetical protein